MNKITMFDIVSDMYEHMNVTTKRIKTELRNSPTGVSNSTYSFKTYTVSQLPINLSGFMVAYASNGRKASETAGNGTGVPVYYNVATNSWLTFHDNSTVLA